MKIHPIRHASRLHLVQESLPEEIVRPGSAKFANTIICGDAAEVLNRIPGQCVQAVVTSPPYYQQRDYRSGLQIGAEETPEIYLRRLQAVFRECHRVLRNDGLLWLNLGDKYQDGRLLGLPWRLALALQKSGWILRSDVIWHKPNAMPHSGKNRPTTDHEYVFMLSKSAGYFYDADAIREPHVTFSPKSRMRGGRNHLGKRAGTPEAGKNAGNSNLHDGRWDQAFHPLGRNKRTVWEIPLSKFRGAHFAVFPEKLVEICLLASTRPDDIALDPFAGSGTVAVVASRLRRRFVAIECNREYCEMAKARLRKIQTERVAPAKH